MTRRWIDTAPERPIRSFVPSGPSPAVETPRKGYTLRVRGDTGGTIEHEYDCPVHGRFRAQVPRANVPDAIGCTMVNVVERWRIDDDGDALQQPIEIVGDCGARSLWCPPVVGIGWAAGEVTC